MRHEPQGSFQPASSEAPPFTAETFAERTGTSPAALADLGRYRDMLADANQAMNLVGPSALATFWNRHVFDSAQLLAIEPEAMVWADLGSGAGFPGLVLAILLKGRPGAAVHLVDSMAKRTRFLQTVVQALDLPAVVHTARAEDLTPPSGLQVVAARACAPMDRLLGFARPYLAAGASGLFLKGQGVAGEIAEARRRWRFTAQVTQSLSDPSGRIVRVDGLAHG